MGRALLVIFFSLATAASAQGTAGPKPATKAKKAKSEVQDSRNFRISFTIKNQALAAAGNFVVMAGSQANYVTDGAAPAEALAPAEKAAEIKKCGAKVNCMPVPNSNNGLIRAECEFQLLGPSALASEPPRPNESLRLQTTFEAKLGHTLVLVDEGRRYIEVKIEEVLP